MVICLASIAFAIAFIATPVVSRFLVTRNLTDRPDGCRKLHARAVPRLGGIAVFVAFALTLLVGMGAYQLVVPAANPTLIVRIAPALLVIFAVGVVDDLSPLSARHKLLLQTVAASLAVGMGIRFGANTVASKAMTLVECFLTILWLVLCTNAFNLIDGMDGLAAGLGLILAGTIAISGAYAHQPEVLLIGSIFAAALFGFLIHNFFPASIFLGDSGSLIIGFLLSCLSVVWSNQQNTSIGRLAPLIAFGVPLADVLLSISRRFLAGRSIFSPDRDHIHHRLLRSGLSVRRSALVLYAVAGFSSFVAVVCFFYSAQAAFGAVTALFCFALFCFRRLNYVEFRACVMAARAMSLNRGIRSQTTLSHFEDALRLATDRACFWSALRQACVEFGFDHVRLTWSGHVYEEGARVSPEEDQASFTFFIGDEDSLTLGGRFSPEQHRATLGSPGFGAFLNIVLIEVKARSVQLQTAVVSTEVPVPRSASVGAG